MIQLCINFYGERMWFKDGYLHRLNGPAFINMFKLKHWYYHNEYIDCSTQKDFDKIIRRRIFK